MAFDYNELKLENQKLKNIDSWKENKFEEEKRMLGGLLEQTNIQLQETNTQLRAKNLAHSRLEAELRTKTESMTTLAEKLDRVGAESSSLRSRTDGTGRLESYHSRLARSMGKCLAE